MGGLCVECQSRRAQQGISLSVVGDRVYSQPAGPPQGDIGRKDRRFDGSQRNVADADVGRRLQPGDSIPRAIGRLFERRVGGGVGRRLGGLADRQASDHGARPRCKPLQQSLADIDHLIAAGRPFRQAREIDRGAAGIVPQEPDLGGGSHSEFD